MESTIEKNGIKIKTFELKITVSPSEFKHIVDNDGNTCSTEIWNIVMLTSNKCRVRLMTHNNEWVLESHASENVVVTLEASKCEFTKINEKKFSLKLTCNALANGAITNIIDTNGSYMTTDWNMKFGKNTLSLSNVRMCVLPDSNYWVIQNFNTVDTIVNLKASVPAKNPIKIPKFETSTTQTVNPGATDNVHINNVQLVNDLNVSLIGNYTDVTLQLFGDVLWMLTNSSSEIQTITLCITDKNN